MAWAESEVGGLSVGGFGVSTAGTVGWLVLGTQKLTAVGEEGLCLAVSGR